MQITKKGVGRRRVFFSTLILLGTFAFFLNPARSAQMTPGRQLNPTDNTDVHTLHPARSSEMAGVRRLSPIENTHVHNLHPVCGKVPGWSLLPDSGPLVSVRLSGALPASQAGWSKGQSVQIPPNAGQPRTTDDMAICVPVQVGFASSAASSVILSGDWPVYAGNRAHYEATVEEFVDCTAVNPAGGTAGQATVRVNCTARGTGPHGEPVVRGPDRSNGYWQDIGTHQTVDISGPGAGGGVHVGSDGSARITLYVPAELLDVSGWLRLHVQYWEGDSRLGDGPVTWVQGSPPGWKPGTCPPGTDKTIMHKGSTTTTHCMKKVQGKYGYHYVNTGFARKPVHTDSGSFQGGIYTRALQVQVHPVALIRLKAVPYAIAYMPPGSMSTTRVIDAVTEGTSYAIGTARGTSNSAGEVAGTCQSTITAFGDTIFGLGGGLSYGDLDCQSTTSVSGLTQAGSTVDADYQNTLISTGSMGDLDPDYAPGDYAREAFWLDTFTIALNQPAAVYDDNGTSVTRFLPAKGYPDWGKMTVIELAACAFGRKIPKVADACEAGYSPQRQKVDLTPDEALSILWLDPFFPGGQSIDPQFSGDRFVSLSNFGAAGTNNCRAGAPCVLDIGNTQGLSSTSGFQASTYTGVTVTNTNNSMAGWTLSLAPKISGVGGGSTLGGSTSDIQGTVNSNGASIGYFASTAVSAGSAITFRVTAGDQTHDILVTTSTPSGSCTGYPDPITVYPYQDNVFGGLLLRDPCAPKPWWWRTNIMLTRIAPLSQKTHQQISKTAPAPIARTAWESSFARDLDRAISTNPHLPGYIRSLHCRASACPAER